MVSLNKLWGSLLLSALLCTTSSVVLADDEEDEEEEVAYSQEAEDAATARYMENIRPVYYPPVPYGWRIVIKNGTVSYLQINEDEKVLPKDETIIRMRYTRKTANMDAETYMEHYIASHSCKEKRKQGTGFYTTACLTTNTYAIVVGEVNNMYIIELTGEYNAAARAIIENYVDDIVHGKRVFFDRNIGDFSDRDE